MKLNFNVVRQLFDALAMIAISANGGCPIDKNGECVISQEQLNIVNLYAGSKAREILEEWETDGQRWEIYDFEENCKNPEEIC